MTDSRPTVLIIDDHAVTRAGLAAILGENGYTVATAPNGRVAMEMLSAGLVVNVILLDMLMPDVDGWHFLEQFKHAHLRSVPIIVMTGVGLSNEWALEHGCFDFIRKPFDERDLLASISLALKPT